MASPYLHVTLRVLTEYKWTFISQEITHGRHHAHDGGNLALIVLYQATNGVHWHIDQMTDVPEHDRLKANAAPTANTEHGACIHSAFEAT